MKEIKVIFMGTPDFSVPVLEGLIENYQVVAVVTQPDKKVGRKQEVVFSPVKVVAEKNNIPVLQPQKIRTDYQEVLEYSPDVIVTCAYGQIIPKQLLDCPRYGCINVHASLLPKLRGGAPIHKAIIEGYSKTGITIMYMDEKMDEGDIISQVETDILDSDNLESLHDRLSTLGRSLLLETLPEVINGTNKRERQNEKEATYAYNIKHEEEKIDFNQPARVVFNQIRGLSPTPGAYALLDGKLIKIYACELKDEETVQSPGTITSIEKDGIVVACKVGQIIIKEIKPEGKKKMTVKDYLNGVDKEKIKKSKME